MRILLVEDDENLASVLTYQLTQEGYETDACENGGDAFYYIEKGIYDIILLDRMLPEVDGISILKKMRDAGISVPVILLTALGEVQDKVTGLDAGADDYLVKPFAFEELLARLRSLGRRPSAWKGTSLLSLADTSFTPNGRVLTGPDGSFVLSKREGMLMEAFFSNPGQVLTRDTLLNRVWGPGADIEDGNLDNYIHFLRRRLKAAGSGVTLSTVRGVGYKLEV